MKIVAGFLIIGLGISMSWSLDPKNTPDWQIEPGLSLGTLVDQGYKITFFDFIAEKDGRHTETYILEKFEKLHYRCVIYYDETYEYTGAGCYFLNLESMTKKQ